MIDGMSDELFDEIQTFLDDNVDQTEGGRIIKTRHDGPEPPNDGNEWIRVELQQGGGFWVLAVLRD